MSWSERRVFQRFNRSDLQISTGEITHQESLDSLTSTASFSPSGRPTLDAGDEVTIEWTDLETGITRYQFFGTLTATDTESHPAATEVPCQGVLAPLGNARRLVDGDLLLTGMTDGEVIQEVLTYCGIDFDEDDIHEIGYTLGSQADPDDDEDPANIWWRAGEAGSTIVDELDSAFFFKLFEIGNGRVVRRYYDIAPDGTGSYRTFTRGVSRDLFAVHRRLGQSSEITNTFRVTGLSKPCGPDDSCTCQVWAKSFDTNPKLGGRSGRGVARTVRVDDSHDIYQDEAVVEWRVRQLMRRNNRLPDTISITTINDTNIHPCSVIGLVDRTTYIDANPRYYLVNTVDRTGPLMTIQGIGGEPGDEGTVSAGTEKLCNNDEGTDSTPGDDLDPTPGYPPLDDGFDFDEDMGDEEWEEEITPEEEEDTIHPWIGCTELDGMIGSGATDTGFLSITAVDDAVWRKVGGASISYHLAGLSGSGGIDEVVFFGGGNATMALNETTPYAAKLLSNDFSLGTAPVLTLTFDAWFGYEGAILEISFGGGGATFYATPGLNYAAIGIGTVRVTATLDTERSTAKLAGEAEEYHCIHPSLTSNNGGVRRGDGFELDQWYPISLTFDYSSWPMFTYYGGLDGGYIKDHEVCDPFPIPIDAEPCDHSSHRLEIRALTDVGSTQTDPSVKLRGLFFGHTTCEINPDFDPTTLPDYEGEPVEEDPEDE